MQKIYRKKSLKVFDYQKFYLFLADLCFMCKNFPHFTNFFHPRNDFARMQTQHKIQNRNLNSINSNNNTQNSSSAHSTWLNPIIILTFLVSDSDSLEIFTFELWHVLFVFSRFQSLQKEKKCMKNRKIFMPTLRSIVNESTRDERNKKIINIPTHNITWCRSERVNQNKNNFFRVAMEN